jgi:hypothetical protein
MAFDKADGFTSNFEVGKFSGNFNFWLENEIVSEHYDRNDMGFSAFTNVVSSEVGLSYNIYEPFGNYNRAGTQLTVEYLNLFNNGAFADFSIFNRMFLIGREFNAYGYSVNIEPIKNHDYWETRVENRYYLEPENFYFKLWFSSDYRKVFAFDANVAYRAYNSDQYQYNISFSPRVRASDKISFILDVSSFNYENDIGWVDITGQDIILGKRNRNTLESTLDFKYTFTNLMGLNFRLRHYWSKVDYQQYYSLNMDGTLGPTDYSNLNDDGQDNNNINFNIFNIDMFYRWVFSPGSEIIFIWKNIIQHNDINVDVNYFQNLENTLKQNQINNFTIKVLYYLDYLWVKKLVTKNRTRRNG